MKKHIGTMTAVVILMNCSTATAQQAGEMVSIQYGTVSAAQEIQAKARHGGGALLGGVVGGVVADDHPGLGALAGGLIGGGIQGHATGNDVLQRYTVSLMGGGTAVIDTEQHDIVVGDCVTVEQGKYANIRRVSSINCQVEQKPEHHVSAASNCQKAKDELNNAKTTDEVELAVTKVRTLCED
jgi:outer membrane lipoprotein SlyB